MESHPDQELREAVIKLESKLEVMSDSISSLASSVGQLVDVKADCKELAQSLKHSNEFNALQFKMSTEEVTKTRADIDALWQAFRKINELQAKNNVFISNAERLTWVFVTGFVGVFFYYIQNHGA
jgi:chromosome segregation ATPase